MYNPYGYPPPYYSMPPPNFQSNPDPVKMAKAWKKFLKQEEKDVKKEEKKDERKGKTFTTIEMFLILLFLSPIVGPLYSLLINKWINLLPH